jgi:hypothetical protein
MEYVCIYIDFSTSDMILLLIHLSPADLGTISYYLPTVVLDDEDDVDDPHNNCDDHDAAVGVD